MHKTVVLIKFCSLCHGLHYITYLVLLYSLKQLAKEGVNKLTASPYDVTQNSDNVAAVKIIHM